MSRLILKIYILLASYYFGLKKLESSKDMPLRLEIIWME